MKTQGLHKTMFIALISVDQNAEKYYRCIFKYTQAVTPLMYS